MMGDMDPEATAQTPALLPPHIAQLTAADLTAAAELIHTVAVQTPIEFARWLTEEMTAQLGRGQQVYFKCENLQRTGSFKTRGAFVRIARLSDVERSRGVVAASAGNHAQGVALAAAEMGAQATIFMPIGASSPKETATRSYGAHVRIVGESFDQTLAAAQKFAAETGAVFIHPFDHEDVILGQATVGLEILQQHPNVGTIVVPVGGGGLAAGVALAAHILRPDVKVVGVQAEQMSAFAQSLAQGTPLAVPAQPTLADGIAVPRPGELTFAVLQAYVPTILTVSEQGISKALLSVLERAKLVAEPSAVTPVAAIEAGMLTPEYLTPGRDVVAVLSGGNIDPLLLMHVVRHGMTSAGRFLSFSLNLNDRPGALLKLVQDLAQMRVNIIDIVHERTSVGLQITEVEVNLRVETRGMEHRAQIVQQLQELGYHLVVSE